MLKLVSTSVIVVVCFTTCIDLTNCQQGQILPSVVPARYTSGEERGQYVQDLYALREVPVPGVDYEFRPVKVGNLESSSEEEEEPETNNDTPDNAVSSDGVQKAEGKKVEVIDREPLSYERSSAPLNRRQSSFSEEDRLRRYAEPTPAPSKYHTTYRPLSTPPPYPYDNGDFIAGTGYVAQNTQNLKQVPRNNKRRYEDKSNESGIFGGKNSPETFDSKRLAEGDTKRRRYSKPISVEDSRGGETSSHSEDKEPPPPHSSETSYERDGNAKRHHSYQGQDTRYNKPSRRNDDEEESSEEHQERSQSRTEDSRARPESEERYESSEQKPRPTRNSPRNAKYSDDNYDAAATNFESVQALRPDVSEVQQPQMEFNYQLRNDDQHATLSQGNFGSFKDVPNSFDRLVNSDMSFLSSMQSSNDSLGSAASSEDPSYSNIQDAAQTKTGAFAYVPQAGPAFGRQENDQQAPTFGTYEGNGQRESTFIRHKPQIQHGVFGRQNTASSHAGFVRQVPEGQRNDLQQESMTAVGPEPPGMRGDDPRFRMPGNFQPQFPVHDPPPPSNGHGQQSVGHSSIVPTPAPTFQPWIPTQEPPIQHVTPAYSSMSQSQPLYRPPMSPIVPTLRSQTVPPRINVPQAPPHYRYTAPRKTFDLEKLPYRTTIENPRKKKKQYKETHSVIKKSTVHRGSYEDPDRASSEYNNYQGRDSREPEAPVYKSRVYNRQAQLEGADSEKKVVSIPKNPSIMRLAKNSNITSMVVGASIKVQPEEGEEKLYPGLVLDV